MYSRSKLITKFLAGFAELNDGSVIGDILITSNRTEEYNGQEFNARLRKFLNRTLHRRFHSGLCIVTRSDKNRLHSHVAVKMSCPSRDFDWVSFKEAERYYALYKQFKDKVDLGFYKYYSRKYRLSMPKEWQRLARLITSSAKHQGLGYARLAPVRKNMDAYKWYLVDNIPFKRDARDKGIHYFSSWSIKTTNNFQVVNKYTTEYRRKLAKFATSLLLTAGNYNIVLRNALGNHWFCRCEEVIRAIDSPSIYQQHRLDELKRVVETYQLRISQ